MSYTGSKSQSGRGTKVSIGPRSDVTGAPTYVVFGELKTASRTGSQWATEDVTNFDSGDDMEFRKTIRDNGMLNMAGNRVTGDAGQVAVKAAFDDADGVYLFKVEYPKAPGQITTGDVDTFTAIVESQDFTLEYNKINAFSVKLKISGRVAETVGS